MITTDESMNDANRKRVRTVDGKDSTDTTMENNTSDTTELQPFTSLPFYGEHKKAVSSLSFAPTTNLLHGTYNNNSGNNVLCASASADGYGKIWNITNQLNEVNNNNTSSEDPPNKKNKYNLPPVNIVNSAAMTTKLEPTHNLCGHSRGINDITWSTNSQYIATASDDKTLRLWNVETGDAYVEFKGHTNFVFSCRFNPQSNLLVSGVSILYCIWGYTFMFMWCMFKNCYLTLYELYLYLSSHLMKQ